MPKLTALFATTTLIAATAAAYFWQQLHTERKSTAQLRQQRVQVGQPGPQSPGQSLAAGTSQSDLPSVAVAVPLSAGMAAGVVPPPPSRAAPAKAGNSAGEPEYVTTSLKLNQLQERYPGVVKELGMTPTEAEAFYDLMMKQQQKEPNPVRAMLDNGVVDEQELKRAQAELEKTRQAEIAAMLGPAKTRQWQEYQPSVEARRRVNELTMMLASSAPLTEKQSTALVNNIFAEQRRRAQDESLRTPASNDARAQLEFEEQNLQRRIESNRRTVDAARSYLNAEQLTLMQDAQTRGNERIRASLKTRREQLEGGAPKP